MAQITPKEFAEKVGSDPKTVRRFLRKLVGENENPGKGQCWSIDFEVVEDLAARFASYSDRTARTVTLADLTKAEVDDSEVDELDDMDDLEDDEELEEI